MQIKTDEYKQKVINFAQQLSDVRFVLQIVFAVIVLLTTWSGIKSIQANYGLQKQISGLRQQNTVAELQNNNLQLQNQYFNSNQYLELAARQNFGLAVNGEKEIVVPVSVAMAYTTELPTTAKVDATASQQPVYQQNFQSWVDFFLHRQANN